MDLLWKHQHFLKNLFLLRVYQGSLTLSNSSVAAQKLLLPPMSLATAISSWPIHIPDPYGIDHDFPSPPLYKLPLPPLTKAVARKSNCLKHRKSADSTSSSRDKPTNPVPQSEIEETSISGGTPQKTPNLVSYPCPQVYFSLLNQTKH